MIIALCKLFIVQNLKFLVHHCRANELNLLHLFEFIYYVLNITFGRKTCKNGNIFKHLALEDNIKMDLTEIGMRLCELD